VPVHAYRQQYTSTQPYFRFDCAKSSDKELRVKISFSTRKGGAHHTRDFALPNAMFLTTPVGVFFIDSRRGLHSYLEACDLTILVEVDVKFVVHQQCGKFIHDFLAIAGDVQLADFAFIVDEEEFPVHKVILGSRSRVFLRMFTIDDRVRQARKGHFRNVTKETFRVFLHFIYTGQVNFAEAKPIELLALANQYELDDLKMLCESFMLEKLTEVNAMNVFRHAHQYKCSRDLKKKSFELIQR